MFHAGAPGGRPWLNAECLWMPGAPRPLGKGVGARIFKIFLKRHFPDFPRKSRAGSLSQLDFLAPSTIFAAGQPQEGPRNPGQQLRLEILCGVKPIPEAGWAFFWRGPRPPRPAGGWPPPSSKRRGWGFGVLRPPSPVLLGRGEGVVSFRKVFKSRGP